MTEPLFTASDAPTEATLYKITLDMHFGFDDMVEPELTRMGIAASVDVLYEKLATVTVPVTYVGTLEALMSVALNNGITDTAEFESLVKEL